MLETLDLFDVAHSHYTEFRIPVIAVSAQGTVLCAVEARRTTTDWGHIDILLRRSTDGGRSFSEAHLVSGWNGEIQRDEWQLRHVHATGAGRTFHNPVLITDRFGTIHFLYGVEYQRVLYRRSTDDGLSWSPPRDITEAFAPLRTLYPWRVVTTGPNHGIQLQNGRLITPVWLARGSEGVGGDHRPSVVTSLYSDDGGESWACGDIVAHENEPLLNPSETVAAQLPSGQVMFNIRSESPQHRRAVALSPDGATNWTRPTFVPDLPEPVCHAGLIRLGDDLIFSNPNPPDGSPEDNEVHFQGRKNLVIHLSRDGGKTWPLKRVLAPGCAGYSDMNVLPDGTLLCFYERNHDPQNLWPSEVHTLARFDRAWLLESTP